MSSHNNNYYCYYYYYFERGRGGESRENEWEISVRETEHESLLTLGNEQGVVGREVGGLG